MLNLGSVSFKIFLLSSRFPDVNLPSSCQGKCQIFRIDTGWFDLDDWEVDAGENARTEQKPRNLGKLPSQSLWTNGLICGMIMHDDSRFQAIGGDRLTFMLLPRLTKSTKKTFPKRLPIGWGINPSTLTDLPTNMALGIPASWFLWDAGA